MRSFRAFWVGVLFAVPLFILPFFATAAPITYEVNRTIGNGTVTGFIQTDGTIGVIGLGNFMDLQLTFTSPSLEGGGPGFLDLAGILTVDNTSIIRPGSAFATTTGIFFDPEAATDGSRAVFQITSFDDGISNPAPVFWALNGVGTDTIGICQLNSNTECMGSSSADGVGNTGREGFSGLTLIAGAAVIPLPAALPLYGTGLAVMGFLGWRRKRQALRD